MNFSYKSRYNGLFQKVIHKVGESAINCIKIFQNAKTLEISVETSYYEDQLIHTFLEIFQQGRRYPPRIAIYQEKLGREGNLLIKNHYLYLTYKLIT